MQVCRVDVAFHYLLRGGVTGAEAMIAQALLPLSWRPDSETWQTIEREAPRVFEDVYVHLDELEPGD